MDPFALPCHPEIAVTAEDRDWRGIGVRSADDVRRKQTRCPVCTTSWTAFLRVVAAERTVEWVRPTPFRVSAVPFAADGVAVPLWQDEHPADVEAGPCLPAPCLPAPCLPAPGLVALQEQTAALGPAWARSVQLCTPVAPLTAGGLLVAVPGELLLERREKWNAQDRRLALLWSARLQRQVVVWHGYARLLQAGGSSPGA